MRNVYDSLSEEVSIFGFAPDYVPFPALDTGDGNAFEYQLGIARQKLAAAAAKEELATTASRSYEADSVSFQNELARLGTTYDNQLAELCGTFDDAHGRPMPATKRYAYLNEETKLLGDPCGRTGTGAIYQAISELQSQGLELRIVLQGGYDINAEIDIELDNQKRQCAAIQSLADYQISVGGEVKDLQHDISLIREQLAQADRVAQQAVTIAQTINCTQIFGTSTGGNCLTAAFAVLAIGSAYGALDYAHAFNEQIIRGKEDEIADLQSGLTAYTTNFQCTQIVINSESTMNKLALRLHQVDLEAMKASQALERATARVRELQNQAIRLEAEQAEMEEQTINVEAARNNPNVRIYKNDAILAAERTMTAALTEAYKATKVFEYYTSQSYGMAGDLFLVRMATHGDISLESYLDGLERAFTEFQESFGRPDLRVQIVSLRDDIMAIPRLDDAGVPIDHETRVQLFRDKLRDPALLDERGYTTLPFGTWLASVSPLTRNHKLSYVEAEIIGSDVGDELGRVYLRQVGTGAINGVDNHKSYYAFPKRTAVLNPFFNGHRQFGPEVYKNERLRDRPLVNGRWELVLNQRDELVNQDVNLSSLSDVRLYLYYTDFTPF